MNRLFVCLVTISCFLFAPALRAQEQKNGLTWYTDITKAYEASAKAKKPIFGFFTGSDWCGWCHKLEHDVMSKPGFKAWAAKNVILLEIDFPRQKKLPDELAQQNNSLQQAFKVQGYPTIWLFNMTKNATTNQLGIAALGSLGYPQSQPGKEEDAFIKQANEILKNGTGTK